MTLLRTIELISSLDDAHTVTIEQHDRHMCKYERVCGRVVGSEHLIAPRGELNMRLSGIVTQILALGYCITQDTRHNNDTHSLRRK